MNLKKILVPIDFSDYSDAAIQYAIGFTKSLQAHLTLIHVEILIHSLQPDAIFGTSRMEKTIRKVLNDIQEQMKERIAVAKKEGVSADYAVIQGKSAASSLLEYVQQNPYDLIIMGTHGRTGIKHFILGSIAEKLVRLSPTPVLTLHKSTRQFRLKHILIPVDFSESSLKAVEYGAEIAHQFQSEITLLHVVESLPYPAFYPEGFSPAFDYDPQLRERINENLNTILQDETLPVHRLIRMGTPSSEIVHYAQKKDIDLILMSTRGLTGLEHILIGSTTERVVRMSEVPVLTIERQKQSIENLDK